MRLKFAVAIAVFFAAMPAFAQNQMAPGQQPPKPTAADAQKVVTVISGDKAKLQAYCDLGKINEQMAQADEKKDTKALESLSRQADALSDKLGPEFNQLMAGLSLIDEDSPVGKAIATAFNSLDAKCK